MGIFSQRCTKLCGDLGQLLKPKVFYDNEKAQSETSSLVSILSKVQLHTPLLFGQVYEKT